MVELTLSDSSCALKSVDLTVAPYKDFGAKPCDDRGIGAVRKGRAWKFLKEKSEEAQLDRIFTELAHLGAEDMLCAGHAAFITDLYRSPKRKREVEDYLAKTTTSKLRKRPIQPSATRTPPASGAIGTNGLKRTPTMAPSRVTSEKKVNMRRSADDIASKSPVNGSQTNISAQRGLIPKTTDPRPTADTSGSRSATSSPTRQRTTLLPTSQKRSDTRRPVENATPNTASPLAKSRPVTPGTNKATRIPSKPPSALRNVSSREVLSVTRTKSDTEPAPSRKPNDGSRVQSIAALFGGGSQRTSGSTSKTSSPAASEAGSTSPAQNRLRKSVSTATMSSPGLKAKFPDRALLTKAASPPEADKHKTLQSRVAELEALLLESRTETSTAKAELSEMLSQHIQSVSNERTSEGAQVTQTNGCFSNKEGETMRHALDQAKEHLRVATEDLEKTRKDLSNSCSQNEMLLQKVRDLESELAANRNTPSVAGGDKQSTNDAALQIDKAERKVKELNTLLQQKNTEIMTLENQITKQQTESLYHIQQIEEQTALHRKEWERELQTARADHLSKMRELEELRILLGSYTTPQAAAQLTKTCEEREARNVELEKRVADLEMRIRELESDPPTQGALVAIASKPPNKVNEFSQTSESEPSVKEINNQHLISTSNALQEAASLRTELAFAEAEQQKLRDSRDGLRQEIEEARKRLTELGATVVDKDDVIRDLRQQLDRWVASDANYQRGRATQDRSVFFGAGTTAKGRAFSRSSPADSGTWPTPEPSIVRELPSNSQPDNDQTGSVKAFSPSPGSSPNSSQDFIPHLSPPALPMYGGASSRSTHQPSLERLQLTRYPDGPHPLRPSAIRQTYAPPRSTSAPPPEEGQRPTLHTRASYDTLRPSAKDVLVDSMISNYDINADFTLADTFLNKSQRSPNSEQSVHFLDASRHGLQEFQPSQQLNHAALTHLYLDQNSLIAFPECLFEMQRLIVLNLKGNKITTVPERIESLAELRELVLSDNCIVEVSEALGNLRKLELLDLSNNSLFSLPFGLFANMESLESLDLSHNQLRLLPPSLGLVHKTLKGLFIADNPLDRSFFAGGTTSGLVDSLLNLSVDDAKAASEITTPSERMAEAERMMRRLHSASVQLKNLHRASYASVSTTASAFNLFDDDLQMDGTGAWISAGSKSRLESFDSGVGLKGSTLDTFDTESVLYGEPSSDDLSPPWTSKYLAAASELGSVTTLSPSLIQDYVRPNRLRCSGPVERALQRMLFFLRDVHDLDPTSSGNKLLASSSETQPYHSAPESPVDSNSTLDLIKGLATTTTCPDRRKHIIAEMLATERTYVRELQNVNDVYMTRLYKEQWLSNRDLDIIFGNITSILMIHNDHILPDLIKKARAPSQPVGSLFVAIAPYMKMYSQYYNNFDASSSYIAQLESSSGSSSFSSSSSAFFSSSSGNMNNTLTRTSTSSTNTSTSSSSSISSSAPPLPVLSLKKPIAKKIRNFLKQARDHPQHTQISLQAFLILPVQRLPRYKLLLEQLLSCTGEDHPDHQDLVRAVVEIRKRVTECNENKRAAENRDRALAVTNRIIIPPATAANVFGADRVRKVPSTRRFVREGRVKVLKVVERVSARGGASLSLIPTRSTAWGAPSSPTIATVTGGEVVELLFREDKSGDEGKDFYWYLFSDILCWCAASPPNGTKGDDHHLIRAFEVYGAEMLNPVTARVRGDGCILYIAGDNIPAWWTSINTGR